MDTSAATATIRQVLAGLRDGLCRDSAQDTLAVVQALIDEATALRLEAIRLVDQARREGTTVKERDTAGAITEELDLPRHEARQAVGVARLLDQLPELAAAVRAGEVSPAAAEAITRARRQPADLSALAAAEDELVELARTAHPDEVAKRARWVVAADRSQLERARSRQRANRGLALSPRADGTVAIDGVLMPEVGEAWRTILDPLVKGTYRDPARDDEGPTDGASAAESDVARSGAEDRRTGRQRMHDVFGELGARLLASGVTPKVHRAPARILVCIDLRSFDPSVHDPRLLETLGVDAARIRAAARSLLPSGAGLLPETGTLLPAEVVRQLAVDGAELIPLLFDGFTPLARGRSMRLADHDLRLGLIVRDQGCVDCGAPPSWCDADHDPPWDDGGRTDPDQLALRCRADHVDRHRREAGGRPTGSTGPPRRGPPRPTQERPSGSAQERSSGPAQERSSGLAQERSSGSAQERSPRPPRPPRPPRSSQRAVPAGTRAEVRTAVSTLPP